MGLVSGNNRAPLSERKDDLYETPPEAVRALLAAEPMPEIIWEPACGPGSIVRVLRAAGHKVYATDLVDYGCPDSTPRVDFLMEQIAPTYIGAILTNPPYKLAERFILHSLTLAPKVAMLLRFEFCAGIRRGLMDRHPPSRVYVFRNRLPRMHRHGWTGPTATSRISFAWFVWDRGYQGPTELRRLSWEPIASNDQ